MMFLTIDIAAYNLKSGTLAIKPRLAGKISLEMEVKTKTTPGCYYE